MPKYYEFKIAGYYLYFTSYCVIECMHVHASDRKLTESGSAKFFVKDNGDTVLQNRGILNDREIRKIQEFIKQNYQEMYLKWSAIYLPLTLSGWIIEGGMSYKYLIYILRNFIFIGENFYSWTLWYLNGLIFALIFIDVLLRKFSIKKIATISITSQYSFPISLAYNALFNIHLITLFVSSI